MGVSSGQGWDRVPGKILDRLGVRPNTPQVSDEVVAQAVEVRDAAGFKRWLLALDNSQSCTVFTLEGISDPMKSNVRQRRVRSNSKFYRLFDIRRLKPQAPWLGLVPT